MWASKSRKSVDLNHFESKSSGMDSGAETYSSSERSSTSEECKIPASASGGSLSNESLAIIGSGDFGRALALRLIQSGIRVTIGSRNPNRNK